MITQNVLKYLDEHGYTEATLAEEQKTPAIIYTISSNQCQNPKPPSPEKLLLSVQMISSYLLMMGDW